MAKQKQSPSKGGGILAQIQSLPQNQQEQLLQAFAQWAQQKGVDIKQLQQDPQALEQALGVFIQEMNQAQPTQQQVAAARHGAKLQYVKSLKHQCAEDEELYYFKKGGKAGCGCRKKNGGQIKEQDQSPVTKFKMKCGSKIKKNQTGGYVDYPANQALTNVGAELRNNLPQFTDIVGIGGPNMMRRFISSNRPSIQDITSLAGDIIAPFNRKPLGGIRRIRPLLDNNIIRRVRPHFISNNNTNQNQSSGPAEKIQ